MSANNNILNDLEDSLPMGARDNPPVLLFEESTLKDLDDAQLAELDALIEKSTLDRTLDYGEPDYLLFQNGIGFMPRGDIQAIKAQQKNGKSMLMDYFMGTMLREDGKYGCLECPHKNLKVLYVDTEMQERNSALQGKRVNSICGWSVYDNRNNFQILTLRGQGERVCRTIVERKVQLMHPDAVFIDGIKDLCPNFNDLEASAQLIRWEMNISTLYNCAVCSVLHVNPNSEKMRGHLGTEEQNKCSDVFTVIKNKKDNGSDVTFKVKQTDARNRDIEDFEFVCDSSRYGTPIPPACVVEVPGTETFVMEKSAHGKSVTITFTHNESVDVLKFFHNALNNTNDAPSRTKLRELFRHGTPLLSVQSDEKADAWIEWAITNGYMEAVKGNRNSTIIRWKQGVIIPIKETEEAEPGMPF